MRCALDHCSCIAVGGKIMKRIVRIIVAIAGVLTFALAAMPTTHALARQSAKLCFSEVPDCIEGRFAEYWQQNGGLPVFGFPISSAKLETVGGAQFLVQTFERNRFELHPENARPYDVLLGRLGDDRLRQLGRPWENEPKAAGTSQAGCQYFAQTGHLVCNEILGYWRNHGLTLDKKAGFSEAESLALFGLPLTEAKLETGSDGQQYLTQWFERARFELHPEVAPGTVLLGLLGRETSAGTPAAPAPAPQPPATDSCADVPDPVNARIRPGKCFTAGTAAAIDVFGFQPNEQVGFWFTSPDNEIFGTVQTLNVGPTGTANDLPLPTGSMTPGIWSFVMEGTSSGNKAIVYFKILAAASGAPAGDTSVPAAQNAVVEPTTGSQGTIFSAYGTGFSPGEAVGVYITAPDQSVLGAPFQVGTDGQGVSEWVYYHSGFDDPPGVYAITFEGVSSKHKAIAYFRILP